jgi:hypothetical protein
MDEVIHGEEKFLYHDALTTVKKEKKCTKPGVSSDASIVKVVDITNSIAKTMIY